ncbi:hypothetical protein R6Q57_025308 [Mikania cordata]
MGSMRQHLMEGSRGGVRSFEGRLLNLVICEYIIGRGGESSSRRPGKELEIVDNSSIQDMSSSDEMEMAVDDLEVDQFDELVDHSWLQFAHGTVARNRRDRFLWKEMGQQKLERMTAIIGQDTTWSRLFEMTFAPQYRLITVEFLYTFVYRPHGPDFQPQTGPQQLEIFFRLCCAPYHLSLVEFGSVLGLYTEEETQMPIYTTAIHTADDAIVSAWWPRIGDEPFV